MIQSLISEGNGSYRLVIPRPISLWFYLYSHRISFESRTLRDIRLRHQEALTEKRRSAEAVVALIRPAAERKREAEERRQGLVIVSALFGNLDVEVDEEASVDAGSYPFIDVTIPLQNLVERSHLRVFEESKSSLAGFYDPCPGEEKQLYVEYRFKGRRHEVVVLENERLLLPMREHLSH